MNIEKLSDCSIDQALELCSGLKDHDDHPCSFWDYSREDLTNTIGRKDKITLICRTAEGVTGIGTLSKGGPFQDHWAEISLAIHPKFRKKGFAKNLVLALEEYQSELNINFIKALILENNAPSRRFFENLGYEHKATLFHDFKIERYGNLSDCIYYKIF